MRATSNVLIDSAKKKYLLDSWDDEVMLCVSVNGKDASDGISNITGVMTNAELENTICAIINWLAAEEDDSFKIAEKKDKYLHERLTLFLKANYSADNSGDKDER